MPKIENCLCGILSFSMVRVIARGVQTSYQTCKIEIFAKKDNSFQSLKIFTKSFILDV